MDHEHDDDIEPEVEVGAEIETARYPEVAEDFEGGEGGSAGTGEPAPAADLGGDDEGDTL